MTFLDGLLYPWIEADLLVVLFPVDIVTRIRCKIGLV